MIIVKYIKNCLFLIVLVISIVAPTDSYNNDHLVILRSELHQKYKTNQLDGYCLYL